MGFSLGISSWQTTNEAGNQSTVYCTLTLYSGGNSYAGYNTSWGMTIGGNGFGGSGPTELWNPNSWSTTQSYTFNHDANGYRGAVACYVSFNGSGGYSPPYMEAGPSTQGAVDYYRGPGTPSSVTATVNPNKTITVTSASVSSPAGTPTYWFAYQANGGAWSGAESNGSSTTKTYTLTPGQNYAFRVYTTNTDGTSGTTTSSSVFLPSGGKIYNGSSWVPTTTAKIYNGTAWVDLSTAKIYNGTSWVNLT